MRAKDTKRRWMDLGWASSLPVIVILVSLLGSVEDTISSSFHTAIAAILKVRHIHQFHLNNPLPETIHHASTPSTPPPRSFALRLQANARRTDVFGSTPSPLPRSFSHRTQRQDHRQQHQRRQSHCQQNRPINWYQG